MHENGSGQEGPGAQTFEAKIAGASDPDNSELTACAFHPDVQKFPYTNTAMNSPQDNSSCTHIDYQGGVCERLPGCVDPPNLGRQLD